MEQQGKQEGEHQGKQEGVQQGKPKKGSPEELPDVPEMAVADGLVLFSGAVQVIESAAARLAWQVPQGLTDFDMLAVVRSRATLLARASHASGTAETVLRVLRGARMLSLDEYRSHMRRLGEASARLQSLVG